MDFLSCIPLAEAKRLALTSIRPLVRTERMAAAQSLGRAAAQTLRAGCAVPGFDRSTVDGFAVWSQDTAGAGTGMPALLLIAGEIGMGEAAGQRLLPGTAWAVATGGMLPPGADAVVMLEHCEIAGDGTVLLNQAVVPGMHVARIGEDIAVDEVLLQPGQKITLADIGRLAACGIQEINVCARPRIGLLSTGDELVTPDQWPQPGQVRDVNTYTLAAAIQSGGGEVVSGGIVCDCQDKLDAALARLTAECDMVLISGGSSIGQRDFTLTALKRLTDSRLLFHGIAMKPGKPTLLAMAGRVPVIGLPGHPLAALLVYHELVRPMLFTLQGMPLPQPVKLAARMARSVASAPGREDLVPVRLVRQADGYWAQPYIGKSGLISGLASADGLVRIAAAQNGISAKQFIEVEWLANGWS